RRRRAVLRDRGVRFPVSDWPDQSLADTGERGEPIQRQPTVAPPRAQAVRQHAQERPLRTEPTRRPARRLGHRPVLPLNDRCGQYNDRRRSGFGIRDSLLWVPGSGFWFRVLGSGFWFGV